MNRGILICIVIVVIIVFIVYKVMSNKIKKTKYQITENEKEYAIETLKKILKALHEKKYNEVIKCVDESKIENLTEFLSGPIQETLNINNFDTIDEYGVECNFHPNYEYSQMMMEKYNDSEDFYLEYDLSSNGELVDLVLQLDFKHKKDGLKCIFENIDPQ